MKLIYRILLYAIIIGGLASFLWYMTVHQVNKAERADTEHQEKYKSDTTTSNGVYNNSTYGFSVNSSSNYYVHERAGDIMDTPHTTSFYASKADYEASSPKQIYSVIVYRDEADISELDFQQEVKDIESGKLSGSKLQLAGKPAVKVIYAKTPTGNGPGYFYDISNGNYVYRLQGNSIHFVESDLQALVNSFKFTK